MKKKILLQIDHDNHPSSFDSIVAIDSGVDHLLAYPQATLIEMEPIIHGTIFTRGARDLHNTAIFFGGSDVGRTVELFEQAKKCFFGPLKVSMMADPNGSNTTAAAAVLCARQHLDLTDKNITVLAGTGPVGQRISKLATDAGANVSVCSRHIGRAQLVCRRIQEQTGRQLLAVEASVSTQAAEVTKSSDIVFAAGAAGVELLAKNWMERNETAQLVLDINAVPPYGIADIKVNDSGEMRNSKICYGAIGVGELKMKIHKKCIGRLFETNDSILDTDEIYEIGCQLIDAAAT